MEKKKYPERTCIGCKETKNKKDLIRIVKTQDNNYVVDKTGKLNGRGAYICNNKKCLELAIKTKALNKAYKCNVPDEIYEQLREDFDC